MNKKEDRILYRKKRLYFVFLVFIIILSFAIAFPFLVKLSFTGLAFGIPEESNFIESNNFTQETNLQDLQVPIEQSIVENEIELEIETTTKEGEFSTQTEFRVQIDSPLPFVPNVPNNTEVKYMGYKFSNRSNIIIATKSYVSCVLDPDATDDGWKNCTTIFEVQNDNATKHNVVNPSISLNHSNYSNVRNAVIIFSNSSNLINETYGDWIMVPNPEVSQTSIPVESTISVENISKYQKRNFTNFTSLPSIIVTETPFALKVNYEARKFVSDQFNLSIDGAGINGFIDPDQNACGSLSTTNSLYTLTQSVTSTGTCFTIGADNVILNCNGYNVNFSTNGIQGNYGIDNTGGYDNLTIKNCNIFEGNGTVFQRGKYAIYFVGSDNSSIIYNNITIEGNFSSGVVLNSSSNYNNISFNILNITPNVVVTARAIDIQSSSNNLISNNVIFTNSTEGNIRLVSADYNVISNNLFNATGGSWDSAGSPLLGGRPIRCADSNFNTIYKNNIFSTSGSSMTIWLLRCSGTNSSYNTMLTTGNQSHGVLIDGISFSSENNSFSFNRITTTGPTAHGYLIDTGSNNTIISDNITTFQRGTDDLRSYDIAFREGNATFVNTTFQRDNILFYYSPTFNKENGTLKIQWYITANLSNYALQGLKDGNVTAYNSSFNLIGNVTTNEKGSIIPTFILTEYTRNISNTFYHTPHRINASRINYNDNFTIINLTAENNPIDLVRTIYMPEFNPPSISITSSEGNSFYESTTTLLTCSASDPNGVNSVVMTASGSNVCSGTLSCSGSITPGSGNVNVLCTGIDIFGNSGSSSLNLQVSARPSSNTIGSSGSSGGGGGGLGSNIDNTQSTSQSSIDTSTTASTTTSIIQTTGDLIAINTNIIPVISTDTIQTVIIGSEAQQEIETESSTETITDDEAPIISTVQIENSETIALVKTEQGNSITVNKGTVNNRLALELVLKTKNQEKVNLIYNIESKEGLDKPKLDLSFNNLNNIKISQTKVNYPFSNVLLIVIASSLILSYFVWFYKIKYRNNF